MLEHGTWYAGCGWSWRSHSATERVMEGLVKRGLLTTSLEKQLVIEIKVYRVKDPNEARNAIASGHKKSPWHPKIS